MSSLWDGGHGFQSFYYLSHAPFLFAAGNPQDFQELWQILVQAGIPANRLESLGEFDV